MRGRPGSLGSGSSRAGFPHLHICEIAHPGALPVVDAPTSRPPEPSASCSLLSSMTGRASPHRRELPVQRLGNVWWMSESDPDLRSGFWLFFIVSNSTATSDNGTTHRLGALFFFAFWSSGGMIHLLASRSTFTHFARISAASNPDHDQQLQPNGDGRRHPLVHWPVLGLGGVERSPEQRNLLGAQEPMTHVLFCAERPRPHPLCRR
jgi:hypothetical protein